VGGCVCVGGGGDLVKRQGDGVLVVGVERPEGGGRALQEQRHGDVLREPDLTFAADIKALEKRTHHRSVKREPCSNEFG